MLSREGINVQMMSQGASKVNISLVVDAAEGQHAVRMLHAAFFEGQQPAAPAAAKHSAGNGAALAGAAA